VAKLLIAGTWRRRIDASPVLKRGRWAAEALTIGLFWGVCALLPVDRASRLGAWLMARIGPRLHKSRTMRATLEIAFPEREPAAIERLLREVWGNLGAVLAEYPHLGEICRPGSGRIELAVGHRPQPAVAGGRGTVYTTAHLANWEVSAAVPVRLGLPTTVVYTPLENPWVDRMLARFRRGIGCTLMARDKSGRELLRVLRRGEAVGLIVDHRDDEGAPVPFLGHDKLTTLSPARLALKMGCALVVGRVERLGPARFRVTGTAVPVADATTGDETARAIAMTRLVNAFFEAWIRERPGDWLCTKRPWPKPIYRARQSGWRPAAHRASAA
jgi:KDO2-lipid IV(A) lauroyltransferase